jgi:hypothetical protein
MRDFLCTLSVSLYDCFYHSKHGNPWDKLAIGDKIDKIQLRQFSRPSLVANLAVRSLQSSILGHNRASSSYRTIGYTSCVARRCF